MATSPAAPEPTPAEGTVRGVLRDFPVAAPAHERARGWLAGQVPDAGPPRLAATVQLLRDADAGGLEVFMQRRVSTMEFAPSMLVYPGGGADPRDSDDDYGWVGPSPADIAAELGRTEEQARQVVVAAVREVFEECGVLLAGTGPDDLVADASTPEWHEARLALERHEIAFSDLLARHGLSLRADLLALRGHWVTPPFEPRRYDTAIFAARMPGGQVADARTTEADRSGWVRPREVLDAYAAGEVLMLPPTVVSLEQVEHATVEDALGARPPVWLVESRLVDTGQALVMRADVPGPRG